MLDNAEYVLALDFGGTKLAAAVVDCASGKILGYQRDSTPANLGANVSIESMFQLGERAILSAGIGQVRRVGISFGGPVSADRQTVLVSNHVAEWEGKLLANMAGNRFHAPAFMENDGNAAALGAWWFDLGHKPENMIYIQVSTGVGAGLILNRALYRGSALAGEFGHITVEKDGPICMCGKRGCIESLCSGWALARDGRDALREACPDSPLYRLSQALPERVDARLVMQAAREGDPQAKPIVTHAFESLAIALSTVICLLDPDVVMLGGGVMQSEPEVRALIEPTLRKQLPEVFAGRGQLQFCSLQGRETLLGAALLGK